LDTDTSQPTEKTTITLRNSGRETSPNTEPLIHTTKTAQSPNQTTGRVPNNAPNPGNAEVPDSAREEDGAPDMMDVREPHSQIKLQVFSQTAEQADVRSNSDIDHSIWSRQSSLNIKPNSTYCREEICYFD